MNSSKARAILILILLASSLMWFRPIPPCEAQAPQIVNVKLWVDEFTEDVKQWQNHTGSIPWLDENNATYIYDYSGGVYLNKDGNFSFQPLNYNPSLTNVTAIDCIALIGATANTVIIDVHIDNGGSSWQSVGNWYGTTAYSTYWYGLTGNSLISKLNNVSAVNKAKMQVEDNLGYSAGGWPTVVYSAYLNVTISTLDFLTINAKSASTGENLTMPFTINGAWNSTPYQYLIDKAVYDVAFPTLWNYNGSHTWTFVNWTDYDGGGYFYSERIINFTQGTEYTLYYTLSRNWDPGGWTNFILGLIGFGLMFFSWIFGYGLWKDDEYAKAIGVWLGMFTIGLGIFTVMLGG